MPHPGVPLLHWTEYQTRLSAYAVVVDDGRVLLALWNEAARPLWTLPGGGVELDETVAEGAVREVREETGYDVELTGLLGVDTLVVSPEQRTVTDDGLWFRRVGLVYAARVVGGALRDEVDGTTSEAQWLPLDAVPGLDRVDLVDVGMRMWAER